MAERLAVIETRLDHMEADVDVRDVRNRNSIHELKNGQDELINSIWLIKVKLAVWSGIGGVLTAIVLKVLDHIWK